MGAKRPLNGVRKCDGQTNKQTHIRTLSLIEKIGPEGRFFENEICRNLRETAHISGSLKAPP